ncbi:hypothetical protein [Devosia sediminis]|uniref:Uncharacterized protein n=1 Tax=Devosia sediminis TaxID=2798801 RepID=A0A934ITF3_9HYPH|nr:hypothetical protein [Devosia sediminis]MBJ3784836.1 hypothetical protein [Devosia sediminis]
MTDTPASVPRPGKGRLAAIVLLGPLVGAFALVAPQFILDTPSVYPEEYAGVAAFLVTFSYLLGFVPAVLAAIVYWLAYPRIHSMPWPLFLLACLLIGALCGALGVTLTTSAFERQVIFAFPIVAMGALVGAVALAVTAMPFRPRPA